MDAETETAIQNLSKDTADLVSTMKQIAKSLANIELHLQAMRPSSVRRFVVLPAEPLPGGTTERLRTTFYTTGMEHSPTSPHN